MTDKPREKTGKGGLPTDIPSETERTGLPEAGAGAAAGKYIRDVKPGQDEEYRPEGEDKPPERDASDKDD